PQGSPLFPYDPHKLNKVGQIRLDVNSRVFLPTSASLQGPAGTWKNSVVTLPAHRCHRASVAAPPQWDRRECVGPGSFHKRHVVRAPNRTFLQISQQWHSIE